MIHKIFSVYDAKAEAYLQPFFSTTTGLATRSFTDIMNDKTHPFSKYPEDYTLFELGTFSDLKCTFEMLKTPISLGVGIEFIKITDLIDNMKTQNLSGDPLS